MYLLCPFYWRGCLIFLRRFSSVIDVSLLHIGSSRLLIKYSHRCRGHPKSRFRCLEYHLKTAQVPDLSVNIPMSPATALLLHSVLRDQILHSAPKLARFGCAHVITFPALIFLWPCVRVIVLPTSSLPKFRLGLLLQAKRCYWRGWHLGYGSVLHWTHLLIG